MKKPDTCCTAEISVNVIDANDSSVISGASVIIYRANYGMISQGTTDNNGNFLQ